MNRDETIVKLKLDIIFKRVFGNEKNEKIIAAFISDLLDIPRESIKSVIINNVELAPQYLEQKFSRLDLKMNIDGKIVNIEIQVNKETYFKERSLFYWSKLYSDELGSGEDYGKLKQTICINIINFNLFDCEDYHSHFKILENERGELLTDKFAIHFFELRKVNKCRKSSRKEDWLKLIEQDTIVMIRQLSADEKVRQEEKKKKKQLRDEASALNGARIEGRAEERNSLRMKWKARGLSDAEIEELLSD